MKKSSLILRYTIIGIFATVLVTSLAFRSCSSAKLNQRMEIFSETEIIGNGKIIDKIIPVNEFDTINVNGKFDVIIENGKKNNLILTTDENIIPSIEVSTINQVLNIQSHDGISVHPKVVITSDHIHNLNLSGKSELHADNLTSDQLNITMNGKSTGYVKGNMKSLVFNLNGKSELHAILPHADRISIIINGKGTLYLTGETKNLMITSHGKAEVIAKDLLADTVVIQSTGETTLSVHAVKSLTLQAFGKSDIQYSGNPIITRSIFGHATVTKIDK
jgi:hypothetical protein